MYHPSIQHQLWSTVGRGILKQVTVDDCEGMFYCRVLFRSNENSLPRNIVSIYNRMALHFRSGFVGNGGTGFQINITRLGGNYKIGLFFTDVHDLLLTKHDLSMSFLDHTSALPAG